MRLQAQNPKRMDVFRTDTDTWRQQIQVDHDSKDLPNSKSINATDSVSLLKKYTMTGKIHWQAEFLKSLNHIGHNQP